ncbi:MAG: protein kinase, partial [Myxococcota bacterium]
MSASSCITDEQALDLIEGRLAPAVREEIDVHLDGCPSCRELVSAFALTAADITESAPRSEPSGPDPASLDRPKGKRALGPLEPGSTLAHFEIVKLLGRGATGEVFVARDQNLGRLVALKIIAPDLVRSPRALRRFLFEAKATSRFNHPHIVTLFEVGEETGHPYVALEYIEGENLKQRAKRDPLAPEDVLDLALSVASALVEAGLQATAIGSNTVVSGTNSTAIGYQASVAANNEIFLGNSSLLPNGSSIPIEFVIDTGFTGELCLP